jgi:hypothetical protein
LQGHGHAGFGQLGQGHVGLIGARLGLGGVGSTWRVSQHGVLVSPSHVGECEDRSGARGDQSSVPPGSVGDWLASLGDV